jgi:hypothetical protein
MQNSTLQIEGQSNEVNFGPNALTPSVLFEKNSWGLSNLGLLTLHGYLSQIPEQCLTDEVVLSLRSYALTDVAECDFLYFCAIHGHYNELPRRFQKRVFLVKQKGVHPPSPLDAAIHKKRLHLLPVNELEPDDMTPKRLRSILDTRQIDCVEKLIRPEHVTVEILHHCCGMDYLPPVIVAHATAEKLLENYGGTPLQAAAGSGCLDQLPMDRLVPHYHQVASQINEFKEEIQEEIANCEGADDGSFDEYLAKADAWLIALSSTFLKQKGAKLKRKALHSC